jgi:RNA polymerase-binding protein DksA
MAISPTPTEVRVRLRERAKALSAEIRDTLLRAESEHHSDIAAQVRDLEDDALADLLVDVNLAEVHRDVRELREIDAAMQRLSDGRYGLCDRCGEPISLARLEVAPAAIRCVTCQEAFENQHGMGKPPRL